MSVDHTTFLKAHTLGELTGDKKELFVADSETPLSEVAATMAAKHVRAMPVWDAKAKGICGVIDMLQVVGWLSFQPLFNKDKLDAADFKRWATESPSRPIGDLVGATDESKTVWLFEPAEPIETVLEVMSKGVHRVLVSAKDDRDAHHTYRMVTQTDICRFAAQHVDKFDELKRKHVEELGLCARTGSAHLVSITTKQTALDGFRRIFVDQVQACAIVDESGAIVGNLSSSDLRGLSADKLKHIMDPVLDFLLAVSGKKAVVPVTCHASTTYEKVLTDLVGARVHRVWVVDAAQKPIGVITASDLICKLSPFDYKSQTLAAKQ